VLTSSHDPQATKFTFYVLASEITIVTYSAFIMKCSPIADNAFGPQYCDNFDFTLIFEQGFFQITPCALLLFALPFRASQLRRQEAKCTRS
jgi:hypothetical protein